jgi:hypothetical protein
LQVFGAEQLAAFQSWPSASIEELSVSPHSEHLRSFAPVSVQLALATTDHSPHLWAHLSLPPQAVSPRTQKATVNKQRTLANNLFLVFIVIPPF